MLWGVGYIRDFSCAQFVPEVLCLSCCELSQGFVAFPEGAFSGSFSPPGCPVSAQALECHLKGNMDNLRGAGFPGGMRDWGAGSAAVEIV